MTRREKGTIKGGLKTTPHNTFKLDLSPKPSEKMDSPMHNVYSSHASRKSDVQFVLGVF